MNKTLSAKEAIVLAGGLGTRLRSAVPDLPKCMAPVNGRPFLFYIIRFLRSQGIERIIFSLGYKHEVIEQYLYNEFKALDYDCAIEAEPLGTGGAIRLACKYGREDSIFVVNGDTLFETDFIVMSARHQVSAARCSLALKPMHEFDRYGAVQTDERGYITAFEEKKWKEEGLINGGVYLLDRNWFLSQSFPLKFSFETAFLVPNAGGKTLNGIPQHGYFIDIGIPEDYQRAQNDLYQPPLDLSAIDKSWSLFLDRDGVINEDKPGSYIFTVDEFQFMPGARELFSVLKDRFKYNFVATNQRGVGRGLMTEEMLQRIHRKMQTAIEEAGGRLDAIYYASSVSNKDPLRKPNPGMAIRARADFPGIDPAKCLMIGNNISDMKFGRNAGMYTVFLSTTNKEISLPHPDIDLIFPDLAHFVKAL